MCAWELFKTNSQFSSKGLQLPVPLFRSDQNTPDSAVNVRLIVHDSSWSSDLFLGSFAEQQQQRQPLQDSHHNQQASSSSTEDLVAVLCRSSHTGAECCCHQLGPFTAELAHVGRGASYKGYQQTRLKNMQPEGLLLPYKTTPASYMVQLVVKEGPDSLQLHIAPRSMDDQEQPAQLQSATHAVTLAGAGGMGQQIVPGTVTECAMDCQLLRTWEAAPSILMVRIPKALVLSQCNTQQLPMRVTVRLVPEGNPAACPILAELPGQLRQQGIKGIFFCNASLNNTTAELRQQLLTCRVVRAAAPAGAGLITLTLVQQPGLQAPAAALAPAAGGAPVSVWEQLLRRRASSREGMHMQDLVNSCLPSPSQTDNIAVEQEQQQRQQQHTSFVSACDNPQLLDGMDLDQQEEQQLAAQRSMPELLQHEAEQIVHVLFAAVKRTDALASVAVLFAEALAAARGAPSSMGKLAALDIEQHSMSSSAQAACASSAPPVSATGSLGYITMAPTGAVECVANVILQHALAVHAQHLGVLQPMMAAAPHAQALLTGPLSTAKLQDEGFMEKFGQDFEMDSRRGSLINITVFRRNLESALHYPGCTAFADREQLPQLLHPLTQEHRLTLHFSRSNCDPTWMVQTLLAGSDNDPAVFMDRLPAMANIYPVAKLMLAVVESVYKLKVSCSLQALICMLLEEDRVQVHNAPSDCMDLIEVFQALASVVSSSPAAMELIKKFAPAVQRAAATQAGLLQVLSEASLLQAHELAASNPAAAYKAKLQACKQHMEGKGLVIAAGLLAAAMQGGQVRSDHDVSTTKSSYSRASSSSSTHSFTPPAAIAACMVPPDSRSSIECAIQHALQHMSKPQTAPLALAVQHGAEPTAGFSNRHNIQGPQPLAGFKPQQQQQETMQQHKQTLPPGGGGAVLGKPPPTPGRRVTRSVSAALAVAAAAVGAASTVDMTAADGSAAVASAVLPLELLPAPAAGMQEQGCLQQQLPPSSSQRAPVLPHKRPHAELQQQQHKRHRSSQPPLAVGGILTAAQQRLLQDVLEQPARLRLAREQQQQQYELDQQLRRKPTQDALSCLGRLSLAEQQRIDGADLRRQLLRSEKALLEHRARDATITSCRAARRALMQHSQDIRDEVHNIRSGGSSSGSGLSNLLPFVTVVVRRLGARLPVK